MTASAESALVIIVPEAEPLVGRFRNSYDPVAVAGVPAHITLLYPFRPPDKIDAAVVDVLRCCFADFAPIRFSLIAARRFPGVLYLAPEPAEPFQHLTSAIWRQFPDTPPYGGKFPNSAPHLTVAQLADEPELGRVDGEFAAASRGQLPISATAASVALMESESGRWKVRTTMPLSGTA